MNETELKYIIEATLLAAGRPVTTQQILELFEERDRPSEETLKAAFEALAADYTDRGIELSEVASGWRIQVRPRAAEIVSRLWQERPTRYSRALLETLALIAYRQPITRSEIEEIRGVAVSSTIMRTLQERNWIRTVGHREVPGRPELLGTTREFLDYFGLKSLDQLPTLAELKDVESIGVQLELPAGEPAAAAEGAAQPDGEAGAVESNAEGAAEGGAGAEAEGTAAEDAADEAVDAANEGAAAADDGDAANEVPEGESEADAHSAAETDEADADVTEEISGEVSDELEVGDADLEVEATGGDDVSADAEAALAEDAELQDADEDAEEAGGNGEDDSDEESTLVATADDEADAVYEPAQEE